MAYSNDEAGIDVGKLPVGAVVTIETLYSIYTLVKIKDAAFLGEGGKYMRYPRRVRLCSPWIAKDTRMELEYLPGRKLLTSRVQNISVLTDTSEYDMGWGDPAGTLGNTG